MVSPYVADLSLIVDGHFGQALPLVVFGGASILAGLLFLILPETLGANLPEIIQDGKDFPPPKQAKKYEENGSSYTYRNESFIVDTTKF